WTEDEFRQRALTAFRHQYETCAPYRALCRSRGVTPDAVDAWEEVPAVPATAFKHFDFLAWSGDAGPEGVFRTSGTTRGADLRGRHPVPRLDLYEASLAEPFRRALLPEVGRLEGAVTGSAASAADGALFLSLIPSPEAVPDSSLSYMVGAAARRFASDVVWLVDARGAWRTGALPDLRDRIDGAAARGAPVLLLGTALAYLHLLEDGDRDASGAAAGLTSPAALLQDLPEGARAMETGGFKGARRTVSRDELYRGIEAHTGVPRDRIVNEYGMTELLSQRYEPVLTEGAASAGAHVPPPWLRVRALDPGTLEPVEEGEEGILAFFDLANLGSVCHILTEDVGSVADGRVRLRGRAAGAEPRGCSRAMDELMSAVRG
ncbi:MAG: hypothetical protein R3253_09940, partial [Longimicrobiales bacterium]|nr:hypothetical protein [Longimicrobiales bacterium]